MDQPTRKEKSKVKEPVSRVEKAKQKSAQQELKQRQRAEIPQVRFYWSDSKFQLIMSPSSSHGTLERMLHLPTLQCLSSPLKNEGDDIYLTRLLRGTETWCVKPSAQCLAQRKPSVKGSKEPCASQQIYALNRVMTELEQRQFDEFCKQMQPPAETRQEAVCIVPG
ncbi:small vasohibin-binding protein isoform X1 [Mirounga angustirostris]|uniref:small vasohibin-binding protein isoform X1 n=1 Tax=Mirounga angustirostris TaxID=9716 RepID=UPI00313F1AFB